jgi:hypothetical protein
MITTRLVNVNVSSNKINKLVLQYEEDVSIGELIRNCCVNLGLQDFDTIDGITTNVSVLIKRGDDFSPLDYDPYFSLKQLLKKHKIKSLELLINQNK